MLRSGRNASFDNEEPKGIILLTQSGGFAMRIYKFSELQVSDKFVTSPSFWRHVDDFVPAWARENEDLVLLEKVDNDHARQCPNGGEIQSFSKSTVCAKVRT